MGSDYNDVGKLLDHMDLSGFAYRSFRKGEDAENAAKQPAAEQRPAKPERAAAAVSAAAPVVPPPAKPQAAAPQPAPQAVTPQTAAPQAAAPQVVAPLAAAPPRPAPTVVAMPQAAAVTPPVAVAVSAPPPAATGEARIGATLDRLMRGSITDRAPKLHLHLELPTRPVLDNESAPVPPGEQKLEDVFQKLHAVVAAKPRAVPGKER